MTAIAADRLKSFVERIEKLREEKKAIGSDERDVFSEAKGVGFDTKAMREVLKRRAMDSADRDEWDNIVDTYEHALGLRGEAAEAVRKGATYDEAAEKTGLSRASVARAVASRKNLENETPAEESCGAIRARSDVAPPKGLEAAPIAPQPVACSTERVPPTVEIGAVAHPSADERVATPESDVIAAMEESGERWRAMRDGTGSRADALRTQTSLSKAAT